MITIRDRLLTLLQEPYTASEIRDRLNIKKSSISTALSYLLDKGYIIVVEQKLNSVNRHVNVYRAKVLLYGFCKGCNRKYPTTFLIEERCATCYEDKIYKVPTFKSYNTIIAHMQSIINEQKQLIYSLKAENFMLQKQIKDGTLL